VLYGYKTLSQYRKDMRLKVFENKVLRKKVRSQNEELIGH